jgi:triacylglycerol esterase/lipase EstA (alpha/beta hydrolase family)
MRLTSLSPRRRLLVVGTALAVLAALAVAGVLALRAAPRPAGPGEVPVLLVPGYDGTPASLEALAARLRAGGRRVVVVALPDRGTGDLAAAARVLERAVDRTGAASVDLVGYSAGGIVVRAFLADRGGAGRARRVVLVGTPNHGTDLAGTAAALDARLCGGACFQLVPGSALLARLNRDETPPGPAFTTIWTARDQTVTPPASARLEGAVNVRVQDVCASSEVGHGGLVRDPLVLGLVARALDGALAAPPGPADCAALR